MGDKQDTMRVVAMVSGGKDSCYNMMQCVAEGHEIVALANLHPKDKGKSLILFEKNLLCDSSSFGYGTRQLICA